MADFRKLVANAPTIPQDIREFDQRIRQICERLGVNPDIPDPTIRLAVLGLMLALQQPEFGKGRGRPKKAQPDAAKLAQIVDHLKDEAARHGPRLSDKEILLYVRHLLEHDAAFGPQADWVRKLVLSDVVKGDTLLKKVSGGRKLLREGTKK